MIASRTPSTMPMTIAMMVRMIVLRTPVTITGANRYCHTTSQRRSGVATSQWTNMATSTSTTAAPTHRPGGGAGRAGGWPRAGWVMCGYWLADGAVELEVVRRAGRQAPLGEDL